jgi:hypothetical protein
MKLLVRCPRRFGLLEIEWTLAPKGWPLQLQGEPWAKPWAESCSPVVPSGNKSLFATGDRPREHSRPATAASRAARASPAAF